MLEAEMLRLRAENADLRSYLAADEVAIKRREDQLNAINLWLAEHGYGPPDQNTAERTIAMLNSLFRDSRTAELDLLRSIINRLEPVVKEKAESGICMHDILAHDQFQSINNMLAALRRIQALKPAKPVLESDSGRPLSGEDS
jgi:hypothetical protein